MPVCLLLAALAIPRGEAPVDLGYAPPTSPPLYNTRPETGSLFASIGSGGLFGLGWKFADGVSAIEVALRWRKLPTITLRQTCWEDETHRLTALSSTAIGGLQWESYLGRGLVAVFGSGRVGLIWYAFEGVQVSFGLDGASVCVEDWLFFFNP